MNVCEYIMFLMNRDFCTHSQHNIYNLASFQQYLDKGSEMKKPFLQAAARFL